MQDQNNTRTLKLGYGLDDRLQHIANSDTGEQADDTYNPQGRRICKILKDSTGTVLSTVLYHYDLAGHLIAETDENGTQIREYLYLGEQAIVMRVSGNRLYYVHNDHLGMPRILTDPQQNKVWEVQTTPFGEISEEITDGITQLKGFLGQMRDLETGYSDNWNRTYDPSIGRYVQSDPIGLAGGLNTYAYVNGNPLSYVDPKGLVYGLGNGPYSQYYTVHNSEPDPSVEKTKPKGFSAANPWDNAVYPPETNCQCSIECKKEYLGGGKSFALGSFCSKASGVRVFGGIFCNSLVEMTCGEICNDECSNQNQCEGK